MRVDSSSRYLAFALKIRKLTDALITVVEEGSAPPGLKTSLREVSASLAKAGERTSVKALRKRGPFAHYESVVTINEVVRGSDRDAVLQRLDHVFSARTKRQRHDSALDAIRFFDSIERRALYHYNHTPTSRKAIAVR